MFTALVATVMAIVIAQVLPAPQLRQRLLGWWPHAVRMAGGRSDWGWLLCLAVPVLLLGLLQWLLHDRVYGVPQMVLGVLVLVLCWGPRDLERDVEALVYAEDAAQRERALSHLYGDTLQPGREATVLNHAVAVAMLRRALGVLFWFLLLGAVGALAYRLLVMLALRPELLSLRAGERLRGVLAVVEWPVAQLMVLTMALVGNFQPVILAWQQAGRWNAPQAEDLLGQTMDAALPVLTGESDRPDVPVWERAPALRQAMLLCWRMLALWAALMTVWMLAAWWG